MLNVDIIARWSYTQMRSTILSFIMSKADGVTLRCPSNSNQRKFRIMAKWKGNTIVAKYNDAYADVLNILYEEAKKQDIYVCKTDKKFLTKSDLEIGQTMGELGF